MLPGATSGSRLDRSEERIPAALDLIKRYPMIPAFPHPTGVGLRSLDNKFLDIFGVAVKEFVFVAG